MMGVTQSESGMAQPLRVPDFASEINQCLLSTEHQAECWHNLVQQFEVKLLAVETELQATQRDRQTLLARCHQLEEELAEQRTAHDALLEASAAQARQFSENLKQLRQNQAQVVQAEKMSSLGQLVAGVAHEINNPVNFIYGNLIHATEYTQDLVGLLELYQQHYPAPPAAIQAEIDAIELPFLLEDLPKLLASLKVGADRIQKIVLSLRSFSRMDEAEVKEVDIHDGIDSTLMILQNRLKAKGDRPGITVQKYYGTLPLVECYAGQLNQVLMNLLSNAIDALDDPAWLEALAQTGQPPTIAIQTDVVNRDRIRIQIRDNGPGIPEAVQQRLFDPFFTTKPVGKGTGLGLSISYQVITETHRGQLTCNSIPGEGATFDLEIPVRSPNAG